MPKNDRPVWIEGMPLDPQHFQQWGRHIDASLNNSVLLLQPFSWGFAELEIERDALANGTFELRRCKGRMPDGYQFHLPETSPIPPALSLKEKFPPSTTTLPVFLAIPSEHPDGQNCRLRDQSAPVQTRFAAGVISVTDENTGENPLEIEVARPNFMLLCGIDLPHGMSLLKLAEISRAPNGTYTLDEEFVPACLSISASEKLVRDTRIVLDRLIATSDSLASRRRKSQGGRQVDPVATGALAVMNSAIPRLRHHLDHTASHPEAVFLALASCAGELTTFSSDPALRPAGLPTYDHNGPRQCFDQLRGVICRILDSFLTEDFRRVPLEKTADTQWLGKLAGMTTDSHEFFLGVSGELPERRFSEDFVQKAKIASPEDLQTLIIAALPGLSLTYVPQPPAALPAGQGTYYYRLTKSGRLWDAIVRSGTLAVFVPGEFKGIQILLYAVQ